jgi:hypothetical protein
MRVQHATLYLRLKPEPGASFDSTAAATGRNKVCKLLLISMLMSVLWCACLHTRAQAQTSSSSSQVDDPASSVAPSPSQTPMQSFGEAQQSGTSKTPSDADRRDRWVDAWLRNTDKARTLQPHYTAPIVTTLVMLVQQYRYDVSWQQNSPGTGTTANYGASRGLEVIRQLGLK